jgi:hypothetical protein
LTTLVSPAARSFSHAFCPRPGATDDVQRLVRATVAGLHDRRVEPVERDVAGELDVDLPELDRGAHVDQLDRLGPVPVRKLAG